ncbi:hypothetical protein BJ742DRAFT_905039 [Cladochytrium replicatum]|nr:hypothetical protein BJ742DRAFT_905039 [Cladochytrium replicatum]
MLKRFWERSMSVAGTKASVVGMTSTFASEHIDFVWELKQRVWIVEEAGELLECQLLCAVATPSLEQLTLIGDHKQLQPMIPSMDLVKQGYLMLKTQQRMRPEITDITRLFDGDNCFEDHPKVHEYPDVPGVASNLFFVAHEHAEDTKDEDTFLLSKSNNPEAEFCAKLPLEAYPGNANLPSTNTLFAEWTSRARFSTQAKTTMTTRHKFSASNLAWLFAPRSLPASIWTLVPGRILAAHTLRTPELVKASNLAECFALRVVIL